MNKLSTVAHIHDEPEKESHRFKSTLPKLSYRQAMQSWFLTSSGAIHQVSTAPSHIFERFVTSCAKTAKNPIKCKVDLVGLNYTELLSRWYALDSLSEYGARVELFGSMEEAHAIMQAKQEAQKWMAENGT